MANSIRDIKLIDLIPASIRGDPQIQAAAETINRELMAVTQAINETILLARIDELPETVVDLLAWQFHVDFYDHEIELSKKRQLVKRSIDWHKRKGTKSAVEEIVSAAFEPSRVLEWWEYGGKPYHFKVQTEDVTTDKAHLTRFRRAIDSVKNTRSWLEKIEFLLHFIDEVKIDETTQLKVNISNYETYPWVGRVADGSCSFTQGAIFNNAYHFDATLYANGCLDGNCDVVQRGTIHDGSIVADGKYKFSTNDTRKILFNAQEIEQLSGLSIIEKGYIEDIFTTHVFQGAFRADGVRYFGTDHGASDNGGELIIEVGRKFDGSANCNAGSTRFCDGIYKCDGSVNFYLDNKRAPLFSGLFLCDGSKRFMQGGEYFATYRYSDQL